MAVQDKGADRSTVYPLSIPVGEPLGCGGLWLALGPSGSIPGSSTTLVYHPEQQSTTPQKMVLSNYLRTLV